MKIRGIENRCRICRAVSIPSSDPASPISIRIRSGGGLFPKPGGPSPRKKMDQPGDIPPFPVTLSCGEQSGLRLPQSELFLRSYVTLVHSENKRRPFVSLNRNLRPELVAGKEVHQFEAERFCC